MTLASIRTSLQSLPLRRRIGAGYLVVSCLSLVCGMAGGLGIWKLGSLLTFITGPAWESADGAMEGSIEIEAQMIAAENIMEGVNVDENKEMLASAKEGATVAFRRLIDAGLLPADRCNELDRRIQRYEAVLTDLFKANDLYCSARHDLDLAAIQIMTLHEVMGELSGGQNKTEREATSAIVTSAADAKRSDASVNACLVLQVGHLAEINEILRLFSGKDLGEFVKDYATVKAKNEKAIYDVLSSGVVDSVLNSDRPGPGTAGQSLGEVLKTQRAAFDSQAAKVVSHFKKQHEQSQLYESTANDLLEFVAVVEDEADATVENEKSSITLSKAVSSLAILFSIAAGIVVSVISSRLCTSSVTLPITAAVNVMQEHTHSNASAVQEMLASIQSIGRNTETAALTSANASDVAQRGVVSVRKLGAAASEIGSIVELIRSIADKTNLLALNATIESARAGESGKGFAVVANEVKELAKQTASATGNISRQIQEVCSMSHATASDISQIHDVIMQVDEINQRIRAAVEQQNSTTLEISKSVQATSHAANAVVVAIG